MKKLEERLETSKRWQITFARSYRLQVITLSLKYSYKELKNSFL
jgi:hypothetical protein